MTKAHSYISVPFLAVFLITCSPASRRTGEYKIALVPSRTGQSGIFVMNSDTTGGKLLNPNTTAQLRASSWSPDGGRIAFFAQFPEDSELLKQYKIPAHFPLHVINASGGSQKRLLDFPASGFEWAPDSRQLLYISAYEDPTQNDSDVQRGRRTPQSAVYLLNLQTGQQRRVTGFGQCCFGSWSPDGSYLALAFGDQRTSDIYIASLDGKRTRRITDSQAINIKPVWSPDGKRIAFISIAPESEGGTASAYTIDADGKSQKRIGDLNAYEVSWSPSGKSLLLWSAEGLFLVFPDENKTVRLTGGVVQPRDAVLTPDGRGVMFRSNHEGEWYLYAVDLNGGNLRKISGRLTASTFCLSPLKD